VGVEMDGGVEGIGLQICMHVGLLVAVVLLPLGGVVVVVGCQTV